jgi:hypothetical protein
MKAFSRVSCGPSGITFVSAGAGAQSNRVQVEICHTETW